MIIRLGAWLSTVVVTYIIANVFATQSVMASLREMGVEVPLSLQLSTTLQDLIGMGSMFLPLVAFAILLAFIVATIITHWLRPWRKPLFILAGAVGMLTLHLALEAALGMTPIATARTLTGLLLQGLAGAVGGWMFVTIARARLLEDS